MKLIAFCITLISGLVWISQSFAAIQRPRPRSSAPQSLIAPLEPLSELRAQKEKKPSFDRDIDHLAGLEKRYGGLGRRERVQRPLERIERHKAAPRVSWR